VSEVDKIWLYRHPFDSLDRDYLKNWFIGAFCVNQYLRSAQTELSKNVNFGAVAFRTFLLRPICCIFGCFSTIVDFKVL